MRAVIISTVVVIHTIQAVLLGWFIFTWWRLSGKWYSDSDDVQEREE